MSMYHIRMDKIKTDEAKPFGWTVFPFDTYAEMKNFQEKVNEIYRQMSDKDNGIKAIGITGEVKA